MRVSGLYILALIILWSSLRDVHAQAGDSLLNIKIQETKTLILKQNYQAANKILIDIFSSKKVVPDELAYFYGLTQFHLGKYEQSRAAFKKYLDLTGKKGEYYDSTQKYLPEADCKQLGYIEAEEMCELCDGYGDIEQKCSHCRGTGSEYCYVCSGKGVVTEHAAFGDVFNTCAKCKGKGIHACSICEGKKYESKMCSLCLGKRTVKIKVPCR